MAAVISFVTLQYKYLIFDGMMRLIIDHRLLDFVLKPQLLNNNSSINMFFHKS